MRPFLHLTGANLKMISRERAAVFWLLMFPVLFMLVLGGVFSRSGEVSLTIAVVDQDQSPATAAIIAAFEEVDAFTINLDGTREEQLEKLSEGNYNAVLVLEHGFGEAIGRGSPGEATMYVDHSSVTVAEMTAGAVEQVVSAVARQISGQPDVIRVTEKSVLSDEMKYIDYLIPGLLAFTLMQAGLLGLNQEMVTYREKGILRRVRVSPLPLTIFLGSGIASVLVTAVVQATIMLSVGWLVFRLTIVGSILNLAALVILGSLSFLALGFLIASLARTSKASELAANAISMPMLMLAGVFFPVEVMPGFMVVIAKAMPLYYFADALRQVMVRGMSLYQVRLDMLVLAAMGLICFIASVKLFRWE